MPSVDSELAREEGQFQGQAIKRVHPFARSVCGYVSQSRVDEVNMAKVLHRVEFVARDGHGGALKQLFPAQFMYHQAAPRAGPRAGGPPLDCGGH